MNLSSNFAIVKRCMQCGTVNVIKTNTCTGCGQLLVGEVQLDEIPADFVEK